MYPEELVAPMREELTSSGFDELKTVEDVDKMLADHQGTSLVVINSVCGCAAGNARPGVRMAVNNEVLPDKLTTVFAGVDREATEKVRSYLLGYPPSSPSMALFKDGQVVHFIPRMSIEGHMPEQIAESLKDAFNAHCK
ncbi:MAG: BrxA/BrxB family bacilliredoxin [Calditrichaeota bacterium]|nr:MAG: BrxA/BrxB family bacilliredoxin [Calditrichota bacterium]MBL1203832.1 BrxA/BrxB family bacilliredoxin [Calditrichota bacterium]NOG43663.1 BrxA/BrxB family bacilliredoxin [Calditrichota bacterium]